MKSRHTFIAFIVFFILLFILIYRFQISFQPIPLTIKTNLQNFNALILARQPTTKLLKHLDALVHVGVNAYLISDVNLENYTDLSNRVIYVSDQSLDRYKLGHNRAWDRAFVWLYEQTSMDYVWIMEDDVTWDSIYHIKNLFQTYSDDTSDLLSKHIIYPHVEPNWIHWPKPTLKVLPKSKWIAAINMLCRVSHQLVRAHQQCVIDIHNEWKQNTSVPFNDGYHFQEFLISTCAHIFNLKMEIYDQSNIVLDLFALNEDSIRKNLKNGIQIFHPVKHDSQILSNATVF